MPVRLTRLNRLIHCTKLAVLASAVWTFAVILAERLAGPLAAIDIFA